MGTLTTERAKFIRSKSGGTFGTSRAYLAAKGHPTVQDICWVAGIYEGEGSCERSTNSEVVGIGQKDRWILDKIQYLFGGTVARREKHHIYNDKDYTMHNWTVCGPRARGFLMTIYKFMSPRRQEQIRKAMALA